MKTIILNFAIFLYSISSIHGQNILEMNGCVKMYGDAEITSKGATYDAYISNECNDHVIVDKSEYKVKFKCVRESTGKEFTKTVDIDFPYVFMKPYSSLKKDKKGSDNGSYYFNEITSQTGRLGAVTIADFSVPSEKSVLLGPNWTLLGENGNIKVSARVVTQSFDTWTGFDKYKVEFLYENPSSVTQETSTYFNYSISIGGLSFPGSSSISKIKAADSKTDVDRFDAIFNFEPTLYIVLGEGNIGSVATAEAQKKPDGEFTNYYSSGKIKNKGTYLNGELNGTYTAYYESGSKDEEVTYVNGVMEGKGTKYYENGNICYILSISNGVIHGDWTFYFENGVIKSKSRVENGKMTGLSTEYYPSGKLMEEKNYVNGKLSGMKKSFYETGELEGQVNYVDGNAEGEYKILYKSGKLKSRVNYTGGVKTGEFKEYYDSSGKLKIKCQYVNDKIVGAYKEYHQNGTVKLEAEYIDGEKQGIEKEFSSDGKLIKETMN